MDIFFEKLKQRKFLLGLLAIFILIVAIPITLIQLTRQQENRSRATAPAISLAFSPNTIPTTPAGAPFSVNVTMNTNGNNVSALDLQITYDQNILTLTSFTPASTFSTIVNTTTVATGNLHFVGVNPTATAITGATVSIGTLHFQGIANGTGAVSFSDIQATAQGQTVLLPLDAANIHPGSYTIGNEVITGSPSPSACPTQIECAAPPVNCSYSGASCSSCGTLVCTSPNPTPTTPATSSFIRISLALPGIGTNYTQENSTPSAATKPLTYSIAGGTNQTGTVTYSQELGTFFTAIPVNLAPGANTSIKVGLPNTLFKLVPVITSDNSTPAAFNVALVSGDVVHDNVIDVNDYNALLTCYRNTCNIQQLQQADLNDDGIVDSKDLNILLRAFATRNGD